MEHNQNADDRWPDDEEPEYIPSRRAPIPVPRQSDCLEDDAGLSLSPVRSDGWTAERIRKFLHVLSRGGDVTEAARFIGKSRQGAYAFRNAPRGRAFALAWDAALLLAHRRLEDDLLARAIYGQVDLYVRHGSITGERHHHDNRLALAMLQRQDRRMRRARRDARLAADEFGAVVEIACRGGQGAADFLADLRGADGERWRSGRSAEFYEAGARAAEAHDAELRVNFCREEAGEISSNSTISTASPGTGPPG